MEDITNAISDLTYKKYNEVRIAQELLKRGFSPIDIKNALNKSKVSTINTNQILGVLFILIAVLANFYTNSTYLNNYFRFDFFSQADFMLFNERILKTTISVSFIMLGVNLLINRINVNKNLKVILFTFLGIFSLLILSYNSYIFPVIFSFVSLLLVWLIKLPDTVKNIEMEKIFPYINKKWKGSSIYVFIIFGAIIAYSSQVEFVFIETGERTSAATLNFVDHYLLYAKPIIFYGGLLTAFLLSINFLKFRVAIFILTGLATTTVIISLFHSNFQNIIYGCAVLIISALGVMYKTKND